MELKMLKEVKETKETLEVKEVIETKEVKTKDSKKKKSVRKTRIVIPNEKMVVFPEGTKVMLNLSRIRNHPDFSKFSFAYRYFVEHNNRKIFTVEYEKNRDPIVVVLKEDLTRPKWLFCVSDLSQVLYVDSDGNEVL